MFWNKSHIFTTLVHKLVAKMYLLLLFICICKAQDDPKGDLKMNSNSLEKLCFPDKHIYK